MLSDLHYKIAVDILSGKATLNSVPKSLRADVADAVTALKCSTRLPDKDKQ